MPEKIKTDNAGIKPTYPETGYGYIQIKDFRDQDEGKNIYEGCVRLRKNPMLKRLNGF